MDFVNPGAAASLGIQEYLMQRRSLDRQDRIDALNAQRTNLEIQQKQEEIKNAQADRKLKLVERRQANLLPGDIVTDSSLIKDSADVGLPLPTRIEDQYTPLPTGDVGPGTPAGSKNVFIGFPQQILAAQKAERDAKLAQAKQDAETAKETSEADRRSAETALSAREMLPPGTSVPADNPMIPQWQKLGLPMGIHQPGQPAMGPDFQGPMDNGLTPQQAQQGQAEAYQLSPTSKQAENAKAEADKAATRAREDAGLAETIRNHKAVETRANEKPPALHLVTTIGPDGHTPVQMFVPEVAGAVYDKPASGAVESRLASAKAVQQTGDDIIAKLSNPAYAASVGPALGRYSSIKDFIGNPPPEYSDLAGQIESYALANMGVHGMRSAQGALQITHLLEQKHTPESLVASIRGLNSFAQHFTENEQRTSPIAAPKGGAAGSETPDQRKARLLGELTGPR